MSETDNKLGVKQHITRRDFLNGVAISALGATLPFPLKSLASAIAEPYYPPTFTGLRGSHPGSFETAHALAWEGKQWTPPKQQTDNDYDLVIVGAGLSGLSAANFYQNKMNNKARILILDNHDDFGGHAKRNEFHLDGKTFLASGGSEALAPRFTPEIKALMEDISLDMKKLSAAKSPNFYFDRDLHQGLFFDKAHYGTNKLVVGKSPATFEMQSHIGLEWGNSVKAENSEQFLQQFPISEKAKKELAGLYNNPKDYFPDKTPAEIIALLKKISYSDFLRKYAMVSEEVIGIFRAGPEATSGVGLDAVSAFVAFKSYNFPGFNVKKLSDPNGRKSDSLRSRMPSHLPGFPDGNSSLARMLVRRLIPAASPGASMEDIVTAKFDYEQLDRNESETRIRLNSTVVNVVEHNDRNIDVTYVQSGVTHRVSAKQCILAGYHTMIPHICPSLPSKQKDALSLQTKVPLVFTNVLISNWRAFQKLGVNSVYYPQGNFPHIALSPAITIGTHEYSDDPDKPIIVQMKRSFNKPNSGLPAREQYLLGRRELYGMTFEDFERDIRTQLDDILSPAGFDSMTDIKAITVNRWPHGYGYKRNDLFDPEYAAGQAPHEIARKQFGNIAIANSDAAGGATFFFAMEQASRAVSELLT